MKLIIMTLLILSCISALTGCRDDSDSAEDFQKAEPNVPESNDSEPNDSPVSEIPIGPPADTVEILGTVVYKNLEGGFFAIDGDDGRKYDPIKLPESFRKDGLQVKVSARIRRNAMSFHMYGAIIEVVNIAAR